MIAQELKILPEYFKAILSGDKTFEVRSVKDRNFYIGETLWLKEFNPMDGYTGRAVAVKVKYIIDGIIYKDEPAVVMSIAVTLTKGVLNE